MNLDGQTTLRMAEKMMMDEVDVDGDSQIDTDEFTEMIKKTSTSLGTAFHATWDIIVSLLILLTVITMPLSLGWEELNEFFFAMNLTVDFVFLFDVCKNFCTGYIDENEAIVMNARMVRKNYVRGFFVTDFCSSIATARSHTDEMGRCGLRQRNGHWDEAEPENAEAAEDGQAL